MDNGAKQWIQCRYEQVFKLCTKCRMIRNERLQWSSEADEVERMLHAQRLRLTELQGVQFEFQAMAAHFSTQPSKHGGSAAIGNCLCRRRRGIRQGGPPAPYLFILCKKCFSCCSWRWTVQDFLWHQNSQKCSCNYIHLGGKTWLVFYSFQTSDQHIQIWHFFSVQTQSLI